MALVIPDNRKHETEDFYWEDSAWIAQATRAQKLLSDWDHVARKALEEGLTLTPEFCAWSKMLREVVRGERDSISNDVAPPRFVQRSSLVSAPAVEPDMFDGVPLPAMDELLLDYAMPDDGVPSEYRGMMIEGESAEKFTERMRRRYRALKHMQMDSVKPSNLRSFPDMLEKEIEELNALEAAGSEAVKWLDVQA